MAVVAGPGNGGDRAAARSGIRSPGADPTAGFASIPAVARATGLIVDTIGTLPWHVYRGDTERLPTPDWIADPQALRLDGRVVDPSRGQRDPDVGGRLLVPVDSVGVVVG